MILPIFYHSPNFDRGGVAAGGAMRPTPAYADLPGRTPKIHTCTQDKSASFDFKTLKAMRSITFFAQDAMPAGRPPTFAGGDAGHARYFGAATVTSAGRKTRSAMT